MKVLISHEKILEKIDELAKKITVTDDTVFLVVLTGALSFFSYLYSKLDQKPIFDVIRVKSYLGKESTGKINVLIEPKVNLKDKDIIIIEDIVDKGRTVSFVKDYVKKKGAKSIKIAALLDKPSKREADVKVDYLGFVVPDEFVVGFGLDHDEKHRELKDIYNYE